MIFLEPKSTLPERIKLYDGRVGGGQKWVKRT